MKVLEVVSSLCYGGTEQVMMNYVRHMQRDDITFDVLVLYDSIDKDVLNEFSPFVKDVISLKANPSKRREYNKEFSELLIAGNYDVVHIHTMTASRWDLAKAAKKSGVKNVIYHSHSSKIEGIASRILHEAGKLRLNRWTDKKLACSKVAGKHMFYGDFEVLNNAVDIKKYAFDANKRDLIRKKYNIDNDVILVGQVGRFVPLKRQKFTESVIKNTQGVNVIFLGDGPLEEECKLYAKESGIEDKTVFAGLVRNVSEYYSAMDVLVLPSVFEGLSLSLVEAQANGLPAVASDTVSRESKLSDRVYFLPVDDSGQCKENWAKTIINAAKQGRSDNVKQYMSDFDIEVQAEKLLSIYRNTK